MIQIKIEIKFFEWYCSLVAAVDYQMKYFLLFIIDETYLRNLYKKYHLFLYFYHSVYSVLFLLLESSMVYMNKSGYIFYRMLSHPNIDWSMKSNRVSFRFVTFDRNGVIVYLGKAKDHLVVELVEGKLQISTDLGKGSSYG